MRRQLAPALRMLLVLTVIAGVAYPLLVTGLSQVLFKDHADGSLVEVHGVVVGSKLVGQEFTGAEWFHGRPSAAGAGASGALVPAAGSGGAERIGADGEPVMRAADVSDLSLDASGSSNLGPTNRILLDAVGERAAAYRSENGLRRDARVPVDAVTASGSGVDPHISVANARLQAARVAEARGLSVDKVLHLIDDNTDARSLGFLGEPGVNVLELNLAVAAASE